MNIDKDKLYQDLNYVLACIRVRENNFINLLEKYKSIKFSLMQKQIINQICHQFLDQQQNNLRNIKAYIQKYQNIQFLLYQEFPFDYQKLISRFWYKLKKLFKVSLQRIHLLNLVTPILYQIYSQIIEIIKNYISDNKSISQMNQIQIFLENKYMYAIFGKYRMDMEIFQSNHHIRYNVSTNFQEKNQKNLLQSKTSYRLKSKKKNSPRMHRNTKILKSLNKQNQGKRQYQNSLSKKIIENENKRLLRITSKMEDEIYDIIDARFDLSKLDKKKNQEENLVMLYDDLFEKNIPNHKIITKYYFCNRQKDKKQGKKSVSKYNNKTKKLLDNKKDQINKSNRKLVQKNVFKKKKKIDQDQIEQLKQSLTSNRIKKMTSRLIKIRPKTAKHQRYDPQNKYLLEQNKKRDRKYKKTLK